MWNRAKKTEQYVQCHELIQVKYVELNGISNIQKQVTILRTSNFWLHLIKKIWFIQKSKFYLSTCQKVVFSLFLFCLNEKFMYSMWFKSERGKKSGP